MARLDVNPADLQRAAENYAELQARATALGPHAAEEVQRIIATHGAIGYPLAVGVVAGLAQRQAALDAKAADFATYSQRFTEHAAAYTNQYHDNARRYHAPTELLDTAIAQAPPQHPPDGYIIWCTPATLGSGFICEFMGEDGGITWRHSPLDITGGMP